MVFYQVNNKGNEHTHLFNLRLILVSVVFFPRACPMAAAPLDRILLSHKFKVVRLLRPFNNLPTALAPLSLILLCERSEKQNTKIKILLSTFRLLMLEVLRTHVRQTGLTRLLRQTYKVRKTAPPEHTPKGEGGMATNRLVNF